MITRIYSIDAIDLALQKKGSPCLLISGLGRASSSGWSNVHLSPFIYVMPPKDGVLDCDMLASPPEPDDIVFPSMTAVSAHLVIENIDSYWGEGQPLMGVRVHASQNVKIVTLEDDDQNMAALRILSETETAMPSAPSYQSDIKPLFRVRDAVIMRNISKFDLHNYDDVVNWADRILDTLDTKRMPCDGAWPAQDIALFKKWIDSGKPA